MKGNHKHGHAKVTKRSPEYISWAGMKVRCKNKNSRAYKTYGAKGITICERWLESFENFLEDMGPMPTPVYTLDRFPDMNGNYEPGNCRWATKREQARNRNSSCLVEYNGKTFSLMELSRFTGINRGSLWSRIFTHGWSIQMAVETPLKKNGRRGNPTFISHSFGVVNLAA